MNVKRLSLILMTSLLVLLTGCAKMKIVGAQSVDVLRVENPWRSAHTKENGCWRTNAELVFEPGDKSSMTVYNRACSNSLAYTILVQDDAYDNYIIAVMTLDEGYTIDDLNAYDFNPLNDMEAYPKDLLDSRPPFSHLISLFASDPGSTLYVGNNINIEAGELYFTFIVQDENGEKIIGHQGPLSVVCDHNKATE